MSYYQKNSSQTGVNPAQKKVVKFNIYSYLREEFFNADQHTFRQIASFYRSNYGEGAYSYMLKTFSSWKYGYTGVSSLTMGRIVECIPKFLSEEKRLYILKCEIHNFLEKTKSKLKNKELSSDALYHLYATMQRDIEKFDKSNLHWFIGKNIFPEEQIQHYLAVCKYALNERLIQSYRQVLRDMDLIAEKLMPYSGSITSASYKIEFFDVTIRLQTTSIEKLPVSSLNSLGLMLPDSFKKYGERYILDELMKMSFYEKEGEISATIKAQDMNVFFAHFEELKNQQSDVTMNSQFKGEGGTLAIAVEFVPIRKSIHLILTSLIRLVAVLCSIAGLIFLLTYYKPVWWIIGLGGYLVFFYAISLIVQDVKSIYKTTNQIMRYGK